MKTLVLLAALASGFTDTAFAELTGRDIVNEAYKFGLQGKITATGKDEKGRKCEVIVRLENDNVSIYGQKWFSDNTAESAQLYTYDGYVVLEAKSFGTAQTSGVFSAKMQQTVRSHTTDFGLKVPTYKVIHAVELIYKNGKIAVADLTKTKPGLSKLVFDPDYSGGNVTNCQF